MQIRSLSHDKPLESLPDDHVQKDVVVESVSRAVLLVNGQCEHSAHPKLKLEEDRDEERD